MTPESPVLAELRPLLDALCEEAITPEQLRRLEELVLTNPEAEAEYIRAMSLQAALIAHVAGLPEPKTEALADKAEPAPVALAEPAPAPKPEEKPKRSRRANKLVAWSLLASLLGVFLYQGVGWGLLARDVRQAEAAARASRDAFAKVKAEDDEAKKETRKGVDAALAAEAELAKQFVAAREAARQAIEKKDFVVRLTGPEHVQPGAPNKWQIETLRHGAVGRPQKLEVVVKDA
jgi:hypothetical protein